MIKLKIIQIKEYNNFVLEDVNNKPYNVNIEFFGDKKPKANDYIYVDSKITKEPNIYTYGPLNSKYSKNIDITEEELIKVVSKTEEYYLQRYYG